MAVNQKISTGMANLWLASTATTFDGGTLEIYSGAQPTNGDATEGSGNLLASMTLPTPSFTFPPVNGVLQKAGTWEDPLADLNGTATWFRIKTVADAGGASTTAERFDGNIGITDGQFNLVLTTDQITAGDPVQIDTFTIRIPI